MRYVPWDELGGRPNVVVDGWPTDGTVLTLSHWRNSGTPEPLQDDLSTQIVFRYLDRPELHVEADAVSNNHFDEDGVCGIFALVDPETALAHRALLIDAASAGDFGVYRDREGARLAFAISALADPERSPPGAPAPGSYSDVAAALYSETLVRLPEMLANLDRYRALWEEEDAALARDEARVRAGEIAIEERPEIDLAIVRIPDGIDPHETAIHNTTQRTRILEMRGRRYSVRYRYEAWVNYRSRPVGPRVDLGALAARLNEEETNGRWTWEGPERGTPLHLAGGGESGIPPERFVGMVTAYLAERARPPA